MNSRPADVEKRRGIPDPLPRIQAFFSAKGGSGTSLLASTYAGALSMITGLRVLLADMDLNMGGIESYTGAEPARSIFHLKPVFAELNDQHIRNVVQADPVSRIDILSSPGDPELAESIEEHEITAFLSAAKSCYDLIVIDAGSEFTPPTLTLLQHAEQIHYILTPDTPSLRNYAKAVSLFEKNGISLDKVRILVNRIHKDNDIQLKDLKGIHPLRIEGSVRADYPSIQSCVNLATPLISRIHDKKMPLVLKDILRLAREMTGRREQDAGTFGQPL